jgi:ABC-2 type transport system permease protein
MRNIKAVALKEVIHIMRDRRTLLMVIVMPLMQILIYGYGINMDVKHLRTYVFDQDRTYLSRRLLSAFEQSEYFRIIKKTDDMQEVRTALDKGLAQTGLIIPAGFTADALKGKNPQLQLVIDGSDSNPANVAMTASQAVVVNFMQKEMLVPTTVLPVDFRPRLWYNPDLKSTYFMLPGLIALMLQLLVPMITANAIVREKEQGNIEQLLVTPIKPFELILGKILPYVVVGLIIATSIVLVIHFMFDVPIRGNLVTLFFMTLIYLVVCLGIGLWASTVAQNQQQASQIVMFFAMPSILLSGFIFPRETMPLWIHHIGYVLPMTYFLKIVRGITLKGMGFWDLMDQALPLLAMAFFVIILSIKRFGKRMD